MILLVAELAAAVDTHKGVRHMVVIVAHYAGIIVSELRHSHLVRIGDLVCAVLVEVHLAAAAALVIVGCAFVHAGDRTSHKREIMAEGVNIGINIAVAAARAGVGRVTLRSTGRIRYDRLVVVAEGFCKRHFVSGVVIRFTFKRHGCCVFHDICVFAVLFGHGCHCRRRINHGFHMGIIVLTGKGCSCTAVILRPCPAGQFVVVTGCRVCIGNGLAFGMVAIGRCINSVGIVFAGRCRERIAHGCINLFGVVDVVAADKVDLRSLVVFCPRERIKLPVVIRRCAFIGNSLAFGMVAVGCRIDGIGVVFAGRCSKRIAHGCVNLLGVVGVVAADKIDLRGLVVCFPREGHKLPIVIDRRAGIGNGFAVGMVAIGCRVDDIGVVFAGRCREGIAHGCINLLGMVGVVAADKVDLCGLVVFCPCERIKLPVVICRCAFIGNGLAFGMVAIDRCINSVGVVFAGRCRECIAHGCVNLLGVVGVVAADEVNFCGLVVFCPHERHKLPVVIFG